MAVPKKRVYRARGRRRRAMAFRLDQPNVPALDVPGSAADRSSRFYCPACNQPKEPHTACPNCGFYRGRSLEIER